MGRRVFPDEILLTKEPSLLEKQSAAEHRLELYRAAPMDVADDSRCAEFIVKNTFIDVVAKPSRPRARSAGMMIDLSCEYDSTDCGSSDAGSDSLASDASSDSQSSPIRQVHAAPITEHTNQDRASGVPQLAMDVGECKPAWWELSTQEICVTQLCDQKTSKSRSGAQRRKVRKQFMAEQHGSKLRSKIADDAISISFAPVGFAEAGHRRQISIAHAMSIAEDVNSFASDSSCVRAREDKPTRLPQGHHEMVAQSTANGLSGTRRRKSKKNMASRGKGEL